jgi:hypothetical protein
MTPTVQRIEEHAVPVETVRTIDRIVTDLSRPVAARHVRTRQQGGATIQFIEWHTAAQYLDLYAPGWCWVIESVQQIETMVVVHGSLTVPTATGPVERHATGVEDMNSKGYGDPVSNASAMAFKRAAAFFGLGRALYQKPS